VRQEPYREQALQEAWVVEQGHLLVPDRPGLGVEMKEEVILANPYHPRRGKPNAFAADGSVVDI
jgi:L-alanine-DL-glutamate epimerase-like enolase superfamily enzyme